MVTKEEITEALRGCVDPELNLDVVTLGLIRKISIRSGKVTVTMTLTTPYCPYGTLILSQVEHAVKGVKGVNDCKINLTFEPAWEPSEELKAMLGII